MRHRFFALIITALLLITLSACREGSSGGSSYFTLNLSENPANLDPQLSTDLASAEMIKNTFRMLMKTGGDGAVTPDAAADFVLSEDGLVYTFTLKEGIYWQNITDFTAPLTADDFVFAFYRIFDPKQNSPYREKFVCIKNAAAIIDGKMGYKNLGIEAVSPDTLEITLEYPCWNFLELLSENAAAPCNEEFFKLTKGRYGLDPENDASCGAFIVSEHNFDPYWNENFITLTRNVKNSENSENSAYTVLPLSITYNIKPPETNEADFEANDIDFLVSDDYTAAMRRAAAENFLTKTVVIRVGADFAEKFPELSAALAYSAFSFEPEESDIPPFFSRAKGIIPPAVTMMGRSYRDSVSESTLRPENRGSVCDEYYGDLRLTVRADAPYSDLCFALSDYWRDVLGVSVFVEAVSDIEYETIKEAGFELLVDEIQSDENSPESFLRFAGAGDEELTRIKSASSISFAITFTNDSEIKAIGNGMLIPFLYGSEFFAKDGSITGAEYIPFCRMILMKNTTRNNAGL